MSPRSLFLSSFGAVYVCAFVSYWLQFEGLYGEDGLLPVRLFWTQIRERVGGGDAPWSKFQRFPCLLWFADDDRNVSALVEGLSLVGAGLGALAVAGVHHGSLFVGMFLCYLSLYGLGQTFLSFQWDIFLLETGAAAVLPAGRAGHARTVLSQPQESSVCAPSCTSSMIVPLLVTSLPLASPCPLKVASGRGCGEP